MDYDPDPGLLLGLEIILYTAILLITGLLSAVDKAVSTVNRTSIRNLAEDGNKRAERLIGIFDAPSRFINAWLVVTIFLGFLTGASITVLEYRKLGFMLSGAGAPAAMVLSVLIITVIASLIFLVIGIVYPRQIALQHTEGVALALSGYAVFFAKLCIPFVAVAAGFTNIFLKLSRQKTGVKAEEYSEEEVMSILEVGQETGAIKEEGKKMIDSIFAFDDKLAYEIMTPRTDVFAINIKDEPSEYLDELMEMRYSRIPAYDEDSDNIVGILNIKDYMIKASENGFGNVDIETILRKPFFVPETKNIDSLFFELQKTKQHIAILIDEYGGFSGIVTMEDIIEEIVGDIDDEYDEEGPDVEMLDENTYLLDGQMDIDDVNEATGTELSSENSETLGGLLIDELGEIPDENDEMPQVRIGNCTFTIESVKDRRIERVQMYVAPKGEEENDDSEEEDE